MLNSIQQIALELGEKVSNYAEEGTITDLDQMASDVFQDCKKATLAMLRQLTDQINRSIRDDKAGRKQNNLVLKEKNRPRTILLKLGSFTYERDCYYNKETKAYLYPLDEILQIEKYERIGGTVSAELVTQATECSYGKSARSVSEAFACGERISRQTVKRKIEKAAMLEKEPPEEKKAVRELHVYADEDHAHLQRADHGKKNQMVPLVTVAEERTAECKGRNRNVNPQHFVDETMDTKRLWEAVDGYIQQAYDVEKGIGIIVHGDGGGWIARGLQAYPQVIHAMDGFHLEKRTKALGRLFPKKNVKQRVYAAIKADDWKRMDEILQELMLAAENQKSEDAVKAYGKYLENHYEEIRVRLSGEIPGSCTEGLVSHVLSERFSRNPMGWSKANLGKLSKLRVYVLNGGQIAAEAFRGETKETYSTYSQRMIEEVKTKKYDWSMYEREPKIFDGNSGTQREIRNLGRQKKVS
ncbi:MAG: ISLre2 family transposase [Oscillospiraceae bacterium]|nr:ISLre2 family transposase [Oscillospiraceae bacterium]